jgi:hypothetical protein
METTTKKDAVRFYVHIIETATDKVIKEMGPLPKGRAERVEDGANINLNHAEYHTRIVEK